MAGVQKTNNNGAFRMFSLGYDFHRVDTTGHQKPTKVRKTGAIVNRLATVSGLKPLVYNFSAGSLN
jgi:hypothetical protein